MVLYAFVTSRIDYCNGILYGLPVCVITKLQRVQNAAARLLASSRKYDHITPALQELQWLPVKYRIHFKILLSTFKTLNGMAPAYSDLINVRKHAIHCALIQALFYYIQQGKLKKNIRGTDL